MNSVLVTCGSVIKLRHDTTHFHLHSHVIKWGGGSGQQSVTGHGGEDDQGSMWIVRNLFLCVSSSLSQRSQHLCRSGGISNT